MCMCVCNVENTCMLTFYIFCHAKEEIRKAMIFLVSFISKKWDFLLFEEMVRNSNEVSNNIILSRVFTLYQSNKPTANVNE